MMSKTFPLLLLSLCLSACSPKWIAFAEEEAEMIMEDLEGECVDPKHHHHKKASSKDHHLLHQDKEPEQDKLKPLTEKEK